MSEALCQKLWEPNSHIIDEIQEKLGPSVDLGRVALMNGAAYALYGLVPDYTDIDLVIPYDLSMELRERDDFELVRKTVAYKIVEDEAGIQKKVPVRRTFVKSREFNQSDEKKKIHSIDGARDAYYPRRYLETGKGRANMDEIKNTYYRHERGIWCPPPHIMVMMLEGTNRPKDIARLPVVREFADLYERFESGDVSEGDVTDFIEAQAA